MLFEKVSPEAEAILHEIIECEKDSDHWRKRFEDLSIRDDAILRGCFKELKDAGLINVQFADNYPYRIIILKDGYLYEEHFDDCSPFEKQLRELLKRADEIDSVSNTSGNEDINAHSHTQAEEEWMNDVQIFKDKYLKDHSLCVNIETNLIHGRFRKLIACLRSISNDKDFISKMRGEETVSVPAYKAKDIPEYDVFISHASKDKPDIIDELYKSLSELGVKIFYDKEEIEWGDDWKERILQGTQKSEFAIIVISENFFGREWTEKELNEFLNRQNRSGQKIILPILHNITVKQLEEKYPSVADIQTISTKDYSCDKIAILFAKQFIKRLKSI